VRSRPESSNRQAAFAWPLVFGLAAATCGCFHLCYTGKDETRHHLIIGVGVVRVSDPQAEFAVASSVRALGVSVTDRPGMRFAAGYSSSDVVLVPEDAEDVRIEVTRSPFGPLRVDRQGTAACSLVRSNRKGGSIR
jgi:hypothetical protein